MAAVRDRQLEPSGGQRPQAVPVPEQQHPPLGGPAAGHHAVSPCRTSHTSSAMGVIVPAAAGHATMRPMATTPELAAPAHPRARLAAAAGFFTQGFVFISLTTRLPKVQDHWHYSDTTLSLLLL